ncbi:hypothetical protein BD410DRAFT_783516, partial [Rickenella mellea]
YDPTSPSTFRLAPQIAFANSGRLETSCAIGSGRELGSGSSGPSHNDVIIIASIIGVSVALLALMCLLWKRPQYFAALRHDRWCCFCARSHKKRNGRRNSWMSFPEDPFTRTGDGNGGQESAIGTEGVERSASTLVFGEVKKGEV